MTVSGLIARYREADERARVDSGGDSAPCSLDPTRVWSVAEFAEVVAAAELSGEMEALLREYARTIGYVCQDNCAHLHCRTRRLLARIDAAKAKGR